MENKYFIQNGLRHEHTGQILVHNYPPEKNSFSYITEVYKVYSKKGIGFTYEQSEPIYFHQLSDEKRALVIIIGVAQKSFLQ